MGMRWEELWKGRGGGWGVWLQRKKMMCHHTAEPPRTHLQSQCGRRHHAVQSVSVSEPVWTPSPCSPVSLGLRALQTARYGQHEPVWMSPCCLVSLGLRALQMARCDQHERQRTEKTNSQIMDSGRGDQKARLFLNRRRGRS